MSCTGANQRLSSSRVGTRYFKTAAVTPIPCSHSAIFRSLQIPCQNRIAAAGTNNDGRVGSLFRGGGIDVQFRFGDVAEPDHGLAGDGARVGFCSCRVLVGPARSKPAGHRAKQERPKAGRPLGCRWPARQSPRGPRNRLVIVVFFVASFSVLSRS